MMLLFLSSPQLRRFHGVAAFSSRFEKATVTRSKQKTAANATVPYSLVINSNRTPNSRRSRLWSHAGLLAWRIPVSLSFPAYHPVAG